MTGVGSTLEHEHRWEDAWQKCEPSYRVSRSMQWPDDIRVLACFRHDGRPVVRALPVAAEAHRDPEMGPCGCLACEDSCPNVAPRDEGSPDACDDCVAGVHPGLAPVCVAGWHSDCQRLSCGCACHR